MPTRKSRQRSRKHGRQGWWQIEVTPGSYASIPCWTSRTVFLTAVAKITRVAGWRSDRVRTFTTIMRALADHADGAGRDVQITARTLARIAKVEMRTVRRHLAAARRAGLIVDVVRGRHTSPIERVEIYEKTDRVVLGIPSVRALTHPRERAEPEVNVRPLRPPQGSEVGFQTVGDTQRVAARRKRRDRRPGNQARIPRPLAAQRAAADLVARYPWLAPEGRRHVGALADVLIRAGVGAWTGHAIATALDRWHARHGWRAIGVEAHRPLAWLAGALGRVLAEDPAPPTTVRALPERYGAHERALARERETRAGRASMTPEVRKEYGDAFHRQADVAAKAFVRPTASSGLDDLLAAALARRERDHCGRCQILSVADESQTAVSYALVNAAQAHHGAPRSKTHDPVAHGLEHPVPTNMS